MRTFDEESSQQSCYRLQVSSNEPCTVEEEEVRILGRLFRSKMRKTTSTPLPWVRDNKKLFKIESMRGSGISR
jgi:hypothetical protein